MTSPKLILTTWLAAVALTAAAIYAQPQGSGTPPGDAEPTTTPHIPGVRATAWFDRSSLEPDQKVRFWINFTNQGNQPISRLALSQFAYPGLVPHGDDCWSEGKPYCGFEGEEQVSSATLQPGESFTLSAEMKPEEGSKAARILGFFRWVEESGDGNRTGFFYSETLEIKSSWTLDDGLLGLLKDLALPIVLLILGVWFRLSEQRRAAIHELWNQLLQKSHQNAERYYLPVQSALIRVDTQRNRLTEETTHLGRARQRLFLWLGVMIFMRRMLTLIQAIGGAYFKDRKGEDVTMDAWRIFREAVEEQLGQAILDRFLPQVDKDDTAATLHERLRVSRRPSYPWWEEKAQRFAGDGRRLARRFSAWLQSSDAAHYFGLLRILYSVFLYETNRPFERWYGSKEAFPHKTLEAEKRALIDWYQRLPAGDGTLREELSQLTKELTEYIWQNG